MKTTRPIASFAPGCILILTLSLAGGAVASSPVAATARLPFTIALSPVDWPGETPPPRLHSYAHAQTADGRWLLVGGLTSGIHGFQDVGQYPPPSSNFPKRNLNDRLWVLNPTSGAVVSLSLADAAPGLAASLTVTNPQSVQVGDKLYVVGGYGLTSDGTSMTTWPTLTVFDVQATADAISAGKAPGAHIRQAPADELLRVTGGRLLAAGGVFYLVFGHDFEGFYTPQSNGLYTYQVRSFRVKDDGKAVSITGKAAVGSKTDNPEFRRRDHNVVPVMRADGSRAMIAYGGVFTPQMGVWHVPIDIVPTDGGSARATLDPTGFKQWMSQYRSANLPMWSANSKTMYTVLFAGISEVYYHPATGFNKDEGVPFIDEVSVIRRSQDGTSRGFLLTADGDGGAQPLRMPGLYGTDAELFEAPGARELFDDDILLLDAIQQKTTIGYIFGGIEAQRGNGGPTNATNLVLEVSLVPGSAAAIPIQRSD